MTSFTLSNNEIAAFAAGLVLAALLGWWLHSRRQRWLRMQLSNEFALAEQNHLANIGLLQQELDHSKALALQLRSRAHQLEQLERHLRADYNEAERQLAGFRQSLRRMDELEKDVLRRESSYQQLLAEHKGLEARAASEKQSLQEKLALLQETREQLNREFQLLANRIFEDKQVQFAEQSKHALNASVEPLKNQIEAFRKKVEDAYDKENAERNQLVGQIAELQKQTRQIGEDAINLTNALKGDSKVQGNWGEVILERLLEQSGLQKGREYDVQVALKDEHGRRRNPDVIVRLPEQKDIVIDSKVSLVHYEQYINTDTDVERERLLKMHLASMRAHIQQLSFKSYEKLQGIRSLDFVFLFVPIEAAFVAALQADQGLFQEAYTKQIILVSPTTLLATLRTVENIWRYEKQNRNAEEIARQAGGLHDQFARLLEAMNDVGRQIQKTGDAYELARKRLVDGNGNLVKRVDGLRKLGAKTKKQFPPGMLAEPDVALLQEDPE